LRPQTLNKNGFLQKWGTPKKLPIRKTSEKTGGFGDTGRPCDLDIPIDPKR